MFTAINASGLRIIWAIAAKDLVDGIRNKGIMSTMLSVLVLILIYKAMPIVLEADHPPILAVYDAGHSTLVAKLEDSTDIDLRKMPTQDEMERFIGRENFEALGLILPPELDQTLGAGEAVTIDGFMDHWVSDSATAETQQFFEELLSTMTGKPVSLHISKGIIYTQPNGGHAVIVSLGVVVMISIFGLSITPALMLEERESRTLDALLVSPASSGQIVTGKAVTCFVYCMIAAVLVLAFYSSLIVHWGVAWLAVVCGALFTIALGLLVGTVFEVKQRASVVTFILFQPLLLPLVFPMLEELLSARAVAIANLIPTVALAKAFRVALLGSAPLVEYGPELLFVTANALVILAVVAWVIRRSDRS